MDQIEGGDEGRGGAPELGCFGGPVWVFGLGAQAGGQGGVPEQATLVARPSAVGPVAQAGEGEARTVMGQLGGPVRSLWAASPHCFRPPGKILPFIHFISF